VSSLLDAAGRTKKRLESVRMHGSARRAGYPSDSMRAAGSAASRHRGRGELLLDWTRDYNYAADPPRHLRHRPVAAAQSRDSDGDGLSSRPG
jgi:hypothetical protein